MTFQQARFDAGHPIPARATANITGGSFVKCTGDQTAEHELQVGPCDATAYPVGVAINDVDITAPSTSQRQQATILGPGAVARVIAGAAVTAGAAVQSDATGRAITLAAGPKAGVAMSTVTAANQIILVRLG